MAERGGVEEGVGYFLMRGQWGCAVGWGRISRMDFLECGCILNRVTKLEWHIFGFLG